MTPEQNKATVLRGYREMVDGHQLELAHELFTPDYTGTYTGAPGPVRGPEEFRAFVGGFHAAFPDLRHDIEDIITDGDTVVVRATVRGTHTGDLMGLPPTGRTVAFGSMSFFTMRDGRAAAQHVVMDAAGMMAQLTT